MKTAVAIGVAALALHLALLPILAERSRRPALEVAIDPGAADPRTGAAIAEGLGDRVTAPPPGELGPGLHNLRWRARYRGGFHEQVAAAARAGPFQSPEAPPCSVRVRLGQALLDDGSGGPHTIAGILRPMLEAQLDGASAWPLGDVEGIDRLSLRWVENDIRVADGRQLLGVALEPPAPGFLALDLELGFERGRVPVLVGLVPAIEDGQLAVRSFARAEIDADDRVVSLVLALLSGDRRASEIAEDEVAGALVDVLAPPPPLDLGNGAAIRLQYCAGAAVRIADSAYAEIPLAVALDHRRDDMWPALYPPVAAADAAMSAPVAVDIDASGLAALVHQLWAAGTLDAALASADLAGSFNRDPDVRRMLSLRVGRLALAGPPSVAPRPGGFALAAELALELRDGDTATAARLFAAAGVAIRSGRPVSRASLTELSLTCRPRPDRLRACYGLLVSELTARSARVTDWLEGWLQSSFDRLFVGRRVSMAGAPGELVLERASASAPAPGLLRIELDARLAPQAQK